MKFALGLATLFTASPLVLGQFEGFHNKGLVGVGRIPADQFDQAGARMDTLGGFSAMTVDPASLVYTNGTISGTLFGLPDRGYGDGANDYRPRIESYSISITPYYGNEPTNQSQIILKNTGTILLTYDGEKFFTGLNPDAVSPIGFPMATSVSSGGKRRSLDPEGLVRMADGSWWICDEYGPSLVRFDKAGIHQETILFPEAFLPKHGNYPGELNFTATNSPGSGRRSNRGLEGLGISLDQKRLIAMLQSPLMQDGGGTNSSRNTRMLEIDIAESSKSYGRITSEHIYQLTLNATPEGNAHTPVSEVLAVSEGTLMVLERDGHGRGGGTNKTIYKKIVLASSEGASNLAGSGYDLEKGAPGQLSLPESTLPHGLKPMGRQDFIDLLDPHQLGRFGLSAISNPNSDTNAISEKWEALCLLPLKDPASPDDYLLLVGNDNDFKAAHVFHNGSIVATNSTTVDIMVLAFRIAMPPAKKSY